MTEPQPGSPLTSTITSHESEFARITKTIETWFTLLKHTVWVQTIFVGAIAGCGIVFFGLNIWNIQRELKAEVQEATRLRTELKDRLAALSQEHDEARKRLELKMHALDEAYANKLRLIRRALETQAKIVLPNEVGKPVYTPSPNP